MQDQNSSGCHPAQTRDLINLVVITFTPSIVKFQPTLKGIPKARASPARLGAPLPIVHLSSPDPTRPVEGLRQSSTSCIVGGSSNTHKHTMAREIEGVVLPRVCTRVLMYPRAVHRPSCASRLSRTWRASLSAKACVAVPPSAPVPSRPSPCKPLPIVGMACSARLERPANKRTANGCGG
jgi:hypothetical protein